MERVEVDELTPASDLPEWASSLDHGRVGHLTNGDVVAFTP